MSLDLMIQEVSTRFSMDPYIVQAVCLVESSMNPDAVRFEPAWKYFHNPEEVKPPGISVTTERIMQMCSWGLMQVMGAVYREYGYRGFLHKVSPNDQLFFGCKHLRRKIEKYGFKEGVQAYNTGSPRDDGNYVYYEKVMKAIMKQ